MTQMKQEMTIATHVQRLRSGGYGGSSLREMRVW
jgi:hypothetical protein